MVRTVLAMLMMQALAAPTAAAGPRDKLPVSPEWMAKQLGEPGLPFLRVGGKAAYDKCQ